MATADRFVLGETTRAMLTQPSILTAAAAPERAATIIRRRLDVDLAALGERCGEGGEVRPPLLAIMRQALTQGRALIRSQFEAAGGNDGDDCVRQYSDLMDVLLRSLAGFGATHAFPGAGQTVGEKFDILATGGYGRAEMAPGSDIDLLFLLPYKRTGRVEQQVELMLYILWDLGLKVGHAVRSVEESMRHAKADITIRTNLLDARLLWGDGDLAAELKRRFSKEVISGQGPAFVVAKLAERDERHRRMGDSRYVLEPNIKENKGGLRDLQTLFWIAKFLYEVDGLDDLVEHHVFLPEEAARFAKARKFLHTVRCHLHTVTGRAEDRLTFDVQGEISRRMGYTDHAGTVGVERFMKHYFLIAKDVGDLTRIFCAALEAESQRPPRFNLIRFALARKKEVEGFRLDGERLNLRYDHQFRDHPIDMIRLFHVAQTQGVDIHPHALRAMTRALGGVIKLRHDPEANRLFLEILTDNPDPEATLRRMNEAGVLGRFVPDFGRVVAQMQYDMYHAFTVDEHTLFAIGILHEIDSGQVREELPLATQVMQKVGSRRALYASLFLHDIAKGRGGDHSELGAKVAERLCPRFGLTPEETETVVWLVRQHLAMSFAAFRRDLDDERTVKDFVELVQSPERLRLLLILTIADIRAVGPGRWNNWKATLLGELYQRAEEHMSGGFNAQGREHRIATVKTELRRVLAEWPETDFGKFIDLGYPGYWLTFDRETHAFHARLVREAEQSGAPLTIRTRVDRARAFTEITIYTADHPGLFAQLTGALALCGANIVDARICTMTNGKALDVFSVQDANAGGAFESGEKLARLSVLTEQVLSGVLRPLQELAKRKPSGPTRNRVFKVAPRVLFDNSASHSHTIIEVNGRDRPGLLHDLTRTLTGLHLQITSAKVSTYGHKAVDVFYVKDLFGLKVAHESKLTQIRESLLEVLSEPSGGAAPRQGETAPLPAAASAGVGREARQRHAATPRRRPAAPGPRRR